MSQLSRKISDENTGEHNIKIQKNSRTGAPEAGSGQQELMQAQPDESLRGANGHDIKTCKAFHIDVADPLLDTGTDSKGSHRLPLNHEGKCRRTTVPLKTVVRLRGEGAVNR